MALAVSFACLAAMLYKRVNLGVTLNVTALVLALLAVDWISIPMVIYQTSTDVLAVSIVAATFGIMLLSQLCKETGIIERLSNSLSRLVNNPKIVITTLPAIIGFLPVSGGALMSAPIVDAEAERINLKPNKKAYANLWFRHTIFPIYPLGQVLITAAALTGLTVPALITRQIPVAIVMLLVGYFISFWKISKTPKNTEVTEASHTVNSNLKEFLISFSPILTTIIVGVSLDVIGLNLSQSGFDVLIAVIAGLVALALITKLNATTLMKPLRNWGIYSTTLAAYGAFLMRNTMNVAGVPELFKAFNANGSMDLILLLTFVPAILGFLTGSPIGGVAIGTSILTGTTTFTPATAGLIYISAYLGYIVSPTHLCFTFTADYFKCSLGKVYKYVIPSFLASFATAILVYYLF
jgi:integral membrane protein (TIGR00529 family)